MMGTWYFVLTRRACAFYRSLNMSHKAVPSLQATSVGPAP